jgi:hypothetical protein
VILVDAIRVEAGPGSLVRLEGDDVAPAVATRLSPHQVGVADLLDGARWLGRYPRHVVLLGLVPESMELAVGLSPRVRPALPVLVERIVEEAGTLGFVFCRRSADETAPVGRTVDVTAYVLGTAIRPETRILSSLPGPHSGPGRAKRAQEILETSRGLCRDIKGRALGWLGERR